MGDAPPLETTPSRPAPWPWVVTALAFLAAIVQLRLQGRIWWCVCGEWYPWSNDTWSRHNSQHLADAYTISHILHGFIFAGGLAWLLPRVGLGWRFLIATLIEASWEVAENTEAVINRYRAVTASLDYHGDTVLNSAGDILSFMFGFWLARRIGLWWSAALFIAAELFCLWWIRDNLTLNIIMLVWPIDAIRAWQMAGH